MKYSSVEEMAALFSFSLFSIMQVHTIRKRFHCTGKCGENDEPRPGSSRGKGAAFLDVGESRAQPVDLQDGRALIRHNQRTWLRFPVWARNFPHI